MVLSPSQRSALQALVASPVLWDAPLAAWTTFRIGGPADALVTPGDGAELEGVLALCAAEGLAWRLLGRGSNILAADAGFRGVVIVLGDGFKYIVRHGTAGDGRVVVRAGAGAGLSRLADWCAAEGLAGLEFAAGIPGSVGGALAMNAGAWGTEMADVVDRVHLVDGRGAVEMERAQLNFSYRRWDDGDTGRSGSVVTAVEVVLAPGRSQEIQERIRELRRKRWGSQPVGAPGAGSFFRNPPGTSAGRLIEEAGLKGLRVGDAEVSLVHANFFINRGRATAADVVGLMEIVQDRVRAKSGIALEPEVQFL